MRNEKITPLYERLAATMSYRARAIPYATRKDVRGLCPPKWAYRTPPTSPMTVVSGNPL